MSMAVGITARDRNFISNHRCFCMVRHREPLAWRACRLEPGKDADVVVWSGDPLEVTTFADHVFVAGEEAPMESRATKLRDRYFDLEGEIPPAYRNR